MLPMLAHDKANHAFYGTVIFTALCFPFEPIVAFGLSVVIGATKELYDDFSKKGTASAVDCAYTALGAFLGLLIAEKFEILKVLF